jgi:UDP-glucose 4-epimerase
MVFYFLYFNPMGAHPSLEMGELPLEPKIWCLLFTQTAAGLQLTVFFGRDYLLLDGTCGSRLY